MGEPALAYKQVLTVYMCPFARSLSRIKTDAFSPLTCLNMLWAWWDDGDSVHLTWESAAWMERRTTTNPKLEKDECLRGERQGCWNTT